MMGNTPAPFESFVKDEAVMRLLVTLAIRSAATLSVIGLLTPALAPAWAADLPTLRGSEINFIPAYPRFANWEGFYVGAHLGYGNSSVDFSHATEPMLQLQLRNLAFEVETGASATQVLGANDTGAAGFGGFAGYNMQFDDAVIGVEFNYTHTNFNAVAPSFPIGRMTGILTNGHAYGYLFDGTGSMQTTDIALLQVRAGYVVDHFMPFVTFGPAVGRANVAIGVSCLCQEFTQTNPKPPPNIFTLDADFSFAVSDSKNAAYIWGYTGGGGFDWALTPNIFARLDYEYIQWSHIMGINSHINMGHVGLGLHF